MNADMLHILVALRSSLFDSQIPYLPRLRGSRLASYVVLTPAVVGIVVLLLAPVAGSVPPMTTSPLAPEVECRLTAPSLPALEADCLLAPPPCPPHVGLLPPFAVALTPFHLCSSFPFSLPLPSTRLDFPSIPPISVSPSAFLPFTPSSGTPNTSNRSLGSYPACVAAYFSSSSSALFSSPYTCLTSSGRSPTIALLRSVLDGPPAGKNPVFVSGAAKRWCG